MAKKKTFDQAYEELQQLVATIQSEDGEIDKLEDQVKNAVELIQYCKTKLRALENEVNVIFQNKDI